MNLYGMVAPTPQRPGWDAFRRYEELVAEVVAVEALADQVLAD